LLAVPLFHEGEKPTELISVIKTLKGQGPSRKSRIQAMINDEKVGVALDHMIFNNKLEGCSGPID
jgi:hypothetical protein